MSKNDPEPFLLWHKSAEDYELKWNDEINLARSTEQNTTDHSK